VRYGSVCSGIEAATAAWHPLGWDAAFFSEIENFPRAVLEHHYPEVPLHGDFTTIGADDYGSIDILVGGTPCQSFSIAGLRKGMDDDRGNLALEFLKLAQRKSPTWLVWENVPGVLSSNGGRDFGAFLGGLVELGYGFAYRVLDAQFFGVPQRRRRVFVVGHIGDWRPAAAVLFESHSLQGNPAPSREKGKETATGAAGGVELCGPLSARDYKDAGTDGMNEHSAKMFPVTAKTLCGSHPRNDFETKDFVTVAIPGNVIGRQPENGGNGLGADESGAMYTLTKTDRDVTPTLDKSKTPAVVQVAGTLTNGFGERGVDSDQIANGNCAVHDMQVRRLTPIECERLQGFPDDFTKIPYRNKDADNCPDGPRYKALGNSMAVPVMRWIGERIDMVHNLEKSA